MTTQEDWAFRAAFLRDAAARQDKIAENARAMAAEYREQAALCQAHADTPQEVSAEEMDKIERDAKSLRLDSWQR